MQEYVTVMNELVMAKEIEPMHDYGGIIIVADQRGHRHVVKRKTRKKVTKPAKLSITTKIRMTAPNGNVTVYDSMQKAADAHGVTKSDIYKYARKAAKSGRWFGWKIEKVG